MKARFHLNSLLQIKPCVNRDAPQTQGHRLFRLTSNVLSEPLGGSSSEAGGGKILTSWV